MQIHSRDRYTDANYFCDNCTDVNHPRDRYTDANYFCDNCTDVNHPRDRYTDANYSCGALLTCYAGPPF
jgi:hypothetical protein